MKAKLTVNTEWTLAEKNAVQHTFTAYSIRQVGSIKWPQFDVLPPKDWDTNSLKHFKKHWENQLRNSRARKPKKDRLRQCIMLAQAELMARVLLQ